MLFITVKLNENSFPKSLKTKLHMCMQCVTTFPTPDCSYPNPMAQINHSQIVNFYFLSFLQKYSVTYPYSVILAKCFRLKGSLWQFWSLLLKILDCIDKLAEMQKDFKSWGDEVEIAGLLQVSTVVSTEYAKNIFSRKYIYLVQNICVVFMKYQTWPCISCNMNI